MQNGFDDLMEVLFRMTFWLCEGRRPKVAMAIVCTVVGLLVVVSFGIYTWLGTELNPLATYLLLPGAVVLFVISGMLIWTRDQ